MPPSFSPGPAAVPQLPWNIALLTERDVALQIPINFVNAPGISVTAACFAKKRYEEYAFARCISNLLSLGFRRLMIDVYWDSDREKWSLCPVQIPVKGQSPATTASAATSTATSSPTTTTQPSSDSGGLSTTSPQSTISSNGAHQHSILHERLVDLEERQLKISKGSSVFDSAKAKLTSVDEATVSVSFKTSANKTFAVLPSSTPTKAAEIIFSVGPYKCNPSVDVSLVMSLFESYFDDTDNTLGASLKYVILNLHAAANAASSTFTEPTPPALSLLSAPSLSKMFHSKLGTYIYRPADLFQQRSNLNESWYQASNFTAPDPSYYNTEVNRNGKVYTNDGWPGDRYIEFLRRKRLVIGFGTVDPQMDKYDIKADENTMFSPNFLADSIEVTQSSNGLITGGCLFDAKETALSWMNASWALESEAYHFEESGLTSFTTGTSAQAIQNLTNCGIAPFLNNSLGDTTADSDPVPYRNFVYSSIWSWLPGEPKSKKKYKNSRCAAFDPTRGGRWYAANCAEFHRAACRRHGAPHDWTFTQVSSYYSSVADKCPPEYSFAVPRTALENRYLLSAYHRATKSSNHIRGGDSTQQLSSRDLQPLWLNFNSLDVKNCWVSGPRATCPYVARDDSEKIYIPTIAALIILILTALTLLVKCGANRRNSKRRRRLKGDDHAWDYEGVPS